MFGRKSAQLFSQREPQDLSQTDPPASTPTYGPIDHSGLFTGHSTPAAQLEGEETRRPNVSASRLPRQALPHLSTCPCGPPCTSRLQRQPTSKPPTLTVPQFSSAAVRASSTSRASRAAFSPMSQRPTQATMPLASRPTCSSPRGRPRRIRGPRTFPAFRE